MSNNTKIKRSTFYSDDTSAPGVYYVASDGDVFHIEPLPNEPGCMAKLIPRLPSGIRLDEYTPGEGLEAARAKVSPEASDDDLLEFIAERRLFEILSDARVDIETAHVYHCRIDAGAVILVSAVAFAGSVKMTRRCFSSITPESLPIPVELLTIDKLGVDLLTDNEGAPYEQAGSCINPAALESAANTAN